MTPEPTPAVLSSLEAPPTTEPRAGGNGGVAVGRIVHFVTDPGETRAAIIVKVWDAQAGLVNLVTFNPNGTSVDGPLSVDYHDGGGQDGKGGVQVLVGRTWHWPPRV